MSPKYKSTKYATVCKYTKRDIRLAYLYVITDYIYQVIYK